MQAKCTTLVADTTYLRVISNEINRTLKVRPSNYHFQVEKQKMEFNYLVLCNKLTPSQQVT
jgi:hypothetical protein